MDRLPDTPLLLSGALGGPLVIFCCTPLRNALTLGSQDPRSGLPALYRKVFRGGFRAGWTGGAAPAVVACPQFLALGPVYHFLHGHTRSWFGVEDAGHAVLPSLLAAAGAGLFETTLTFGSQSRNAQMAYNKSFVQFSSVVEGGRRELPLNSMTQIWGVGAGAMAARNMLTNMSIRSISPFLREKLPAGSMGEQSKAALCDVLCSLVGSMLSAPVHQLFNFLATTPEAATMPREARWRLAKRFLNQQYFVPLPQEVMVTADLGAAAPPVQYSWRISRIAARDLGMRTIYVTAIYTLFMSIERTLCTVMRQ